MRLKPWILKGLAAIAGTAFCAGALAGCTLGGREWGGCAAVGAGLGAGAGAASGIVIYDNSRKGPPNSSGKAWTGAGGAVAGALIGGLAGHFICDPLVPPPPPPPPPPPAPAQHEKLVLRGVHFDFNKSNIRAGDAAILDEAVGILQSHPDVNIYVDGYCDAIGSEEYNLKLSQRRADSVAKYLEDHGIASSRLIPRGFGKTNFVASNDTDEGRAQNRRVELVPTN